MGDPPPPLFLITQSRNLKVESLLFHFRICNSFLVDHKRDSNLTLCSYGSFYRTHTRKRKSTLRQVAVRPSRHSPPHVFPVHLYHPGTHRQFLSNLTFSKLIESDPKAPNTTLPSSWYPFTPSSSLPLFVLKNDTIEDLHYPGQSLKCGTFFAWNPDPDLQTLTVVPKVFTLLHGFAPVPFVTK